MAYTHCERCEETKYCIKLVASDGEPSWLCKPCKALRDIEEGYEEEVHAGEDK